MGTIFLRVLGVTGIAIVPRILPIGGKCLQCDFKQANFHSGAYQESLEEPSVKPDNGEHAELKSAVRRMRAARTKLGFEDRETGIDVRWRMDECMYINRRICEEIGSMLENVEGLEGAVEDVSVVGSLFEGFQERQRAIVEALVRRYLPGGWRAKLFTAANERSERRRKIALDRLVAEGGGVKEKYDLMWVQQWERRVMLEQVGSASGIWRLVISYIGGVPPVLLDYARDVNRRDGPTAELRKIHGPRLYDITEFALEVRALAAAIADAEERLADLDAFETLSGSVSEYRDVVESYLTILQAALSRSPLYADLSPVKEAAGVPYKRRPARVGVTDDLGGL